MINILIGCLGFIVIHLFEIVSIKNIPRVKPVIWIVGTGLLVYSISQLVIQPEKLVIPDWALVPGWILLFISGSLLIVALFVNLPFHKTYVSTGVSEKLITTGMYALVRHPGVIWLALFLLSLVLVTRSELLLVATPVFIAIDIILVFVQDKYFFGKMFEDYQQYRLNTPMLLPNRKSINNFVRSIKTTGT